MGEMVYSVRSVFHEPTPGEHVWVGFAAAKPELGTTRQVAEPPDVTVLGPPMMEPPDGALGVTVTTPAALVKVTSTVQLAVTAPVV